VANAGRAGTQRTLRFLIASIKDFWAEDSQRPIRGRVRSGAWHGPITKKGSMMSTIENAGREEQDCPAAITAEVVGPSCTVGADAVSLSLNEQVREYVRASKAESTIRGYQTDWRAFCAWCEAHSFCPLPASPETVAAYIAECASRLKVGSLQRRLNAITEAHKTVGTEPPTHAGIVRNTMKGIRRTFGTAPAQKAAALTDDIRAMVDRTDAGLIGARDRALVLLGFAGAFRRSELVGLNFEDCTFGKDGLTITLRRSKTDQEGAGRKIGIPYGSNPDTCPIRTIQEWLEQSGVSSGPLFRSINRHGQVQTGRLSGIDVARVVKKLADRAGMDASKYAGHSLRAGHVTSADIAGASERSIMNQTGHRSVQMVRRYIRDGRLFRDNSAGKLGL
jgi:integrase